MTDRDRAMSRRRTLAISAGALTSGLAGCLGDGSADGADTDGPVVVASFFSFYDFGRQIAEDTPLEVRNLVPTGLHGHGWNPNASITREIINADAFIHVGEEFQPWADRAIETLEDDNVETARINAREDVELVSLAASLDEDEEGVGESRGKDPHFWLDPQRAKQSVDTIAAGFADVAPDHEATFQENAAAYKSDVLDQIDRDYERIFEQSDRRVVQLAAHNAFQYIGVRYDVEMRPLVTNLAASGDVKPSDIADAKEVIRTNDIDYVGNGVFEARRPAKQLLSETQVKAYFPVTPYAGVRERWEENDWGYEEVAYNINMPTFEVTLGNKAPQEAGPDGWHDRWRNFE
jgi:zinc transport system substrate-binding protein